VRTFKERFELGDSSNQLVAVDIGKRSTHTDEFVVFWLPRSRLLFETEQGWTTVNGTLRATGRAEGFLKVLASEHLDVDRIVQSWPMRGTSAQLTRAKLDSLAQERAARR
jgi:hypothetical protein